MEFLLEKPQNLMVSDSDIDGRIVAIRKWKFDSGGNSVVLALREFWEYQDSDARNRIDKSPNVDLQKHYNSFTTLIYPNLQFHYNRKLWLQI